MCKSFIEVKVPTYSDSTANAKDVNGKPDNILKRDA